MPDVALAHLMLISDRDVGSLGTEQRGYDRYARSYSREGNEGRVQSTNDRVNAIELNAQGVCHVRGRPSLSPHSFDGRNLRVETGLQYLTGGPNSELLADLVNALPGDPVTRGHGRMALTVSQLFSDGLSPGTLSITYFAREHRRQAGTVFDGQIYPKVKVGSIGFGDMLDVRFGEAVPIRNRVNGIPSEQIIDHQLFSPAPLFMREALIGRPCIHRSPS